jgi:hypothetical protein
LTRLRPFVVAFLVGVLGRLTLFEHDDASPVSGGQLRVVEASGRQMRVRVGEGRVLRVAPGRARIWWRGRGVAVALDDQGRLRVFPATGPLDVEFTPGVRLRVAVARTEARATAAVTRYEAMASGESSSLPAVFALVEAAASP